MLYQIADGGESSKASVAYRDMVTFLWTVIWQGGEESCITTVRANNYIHKTAAYLVPLPIGWDDVLELLSVVHRSQNISEQHLPSDVYKCNCKILGVPRHVQLSDDGVTVGSCVALMVAGRRVNHVLVAHVCGNMWRCSIGAHLQNGNIVMDTIWREYDCVTIDIVDCAWSGLAVARRISSHLMFDHLQQLISKHMDLFSELVANETWVAEIIRSRMTKTSTDFNNASSGFDPNLFTRSCTDQYFSKTHIYVAWVWECQGETRLFKQQIRVEHIRGMEIPLPETLLSDEHLSYSLIRRAERESKYFFCSCAYLGVEISLNQFERHPSQWKHVVSNRNAQVWIEFEHVQNADTNKPYRVKVSARNWIYRTNRTPGHPLYVTASRSLRFSIEFMDSFAQNYIDGMKFLGVCYDNPERPEILRHLPNDIDIHREHSVTAIMCVVDVEASSFFLFLLFC